MRPRRLLTLLALVAGLVVVPAALGAPGDQSMVTGPYQLTAGRTAEVAISVTAGDYSAIRRRCRVVIRSGGRVVRWPGSRAAK